MTTVDHKRLGLLYVLYALVFLVIAGCEALVIRIQLMFPHNDFVSPQVFNRMFTMHGTTMIFFFAMPILFGFGNYLVPLMIGARDLAFPRLNAFSFWMWLSGSLLLLFSYLGGDGLLGAGTASASLANGRTTVRIPPPTVQPAFNLSGRSFPKTRFTPV
jgi:cytochrome c oxidase subunit 1